MDGVQIGTFGRLLMVLTSSFLLTVLTVTPAVESYGTRPTIPKDRTESHTEIGITEGDFTHKEGQRERQIV